MTNQNVLTVKVLLFAQYISKVISIIYIKNQKNIIKDISNNKFMIHMISKKIDINVLQKNIIYIIKKLYYRNYVESIKKIHLKYILKNKFFFI